jgi:hypothetical protein
MLELKKKNYVAHMHWLFQAMVENVMTCTNAMWLKVSEEKDTCFQDSQIYNVSIKLFLKYLNPSK